MISIPQNVLDLGLGVAVVFLVLLIITQIVKLVGHLKDAKDKRTSFENGNEKRIPCSASPIMHSLVGGQSKMFDTHSRLEGVLKQLSDNSVKQTHILESLQKSQDVAVKIQGTQSRILAQMCIKMKMDASHEVAVELGGD